MNSIRRIASPPFLRKAFLYELPRIAMMLAAFFLYQACKPKSSLPGESSDLASVTIKELAVGDYERYQLELIAEDGSARSVIKREFTRGSGSIQLQVVPGVYRFVLEYFRANTLLFSSKSCSTALRNDQRELSKGKNDIMIRVCGSDKQAIGEGNDVQPSVQGTFSVKDAQIVDPSGKAFVMRGINNPHAYYKDRAYDALTTIKDLGFNTVRIVWCADTLIRANRCDPKDIHPIGELDRILTRMRALKLVAVLNLQNATGSDNRADLQAMVDYLLKPEVKAVLLKHKDMLLINIANEWYGTWNKRRDYIDAYAAMVPQLRRGQLPHTLIVDARGYGQDFSSITEHGSELKNLDANLVISSHMYDVYSTPSVVRNVFQTVRNAKIPFIVGEFSCSHGVGKPVACDSILVEAETGEYKIGTLAWSMSGNSSDLVDLDLVEASDWRTLTQFGRKIIQTPSYGIQSSAREACFFNPRSCL